MFHSTLDPSKKLPLSHLSKARLKQAHWHTITRVHQPKSLQMQALLALELCYAKPEWGMATDIYAMQEAASQSVNKDTPRLGRRPFPLYGHTKSITHASIECDLI